MTGELFLMMQRMIPDILSTKTLDIPFSYCMIQLDAFVQI